MVSASRARVVGWPGSGWGTSGPNTRQASVGIAIETGSPTASGDAPGARQAGAATRFSDGGLGVWQSVHAVAVGSTAADGSSVTASSITLAPGATSGGSAFQPTIVGRVISHGRSSSAGEQRRRDGDERER